MQTLNWVFKKPHKTPERTGAKKKTIPKSLPIYGYLHTYGASMIHPPTKRPRKIVTPTKHSFNILYAVIFFHYCDISLSWHFTTVTFCLKTIYNCNIFSLWCFTAATFHHRKDLLMQHFEPTQCFTTATFRSSMMHPGNLCSPLFLGWHITVLAHPPFFTWIAELGTHFYLHFALALSRSFAELFALALSRSFLGLKFRAFALPRSLIFRALFTRS